MADTDRPPLCYVAGPMTGLPRFNFDAFDEATAQLRDAGFAVASPAEVSRNQGVDPEMPAEEVDDEFVQRLMRVDLCLVMEADFLFMLPGWERSRGARCEAQVARAIGTPVFDHEMNLIDLAILDEARPA